MARLLLRCGNDYNGDHNFYRQGCVKILPREHTKKLINCSEMSTIASILLAVHEFSCAWIHVAGVIRMIVDEVRESARSLHDRLLAKLRGPIQLSNCLQVSVMCVSVCILPPCRRENHFFIGI